MTHILPALLLSSVYIGYGSLLLGCIRTEFIPLTVFAAQICLLYIAALVGLLGPAALGFLLLGGLLLLRFALRAVRKKPISWRDLLCPGMAFFVIACAALCIMLRGARFMHYDNFSHWGLMVKHLALTNRLPNAGDLYIAFRQYSPGSAMFIYLFTYVFGFSESIAILAQDILMVSAMTCMFAFVKGWRSLLSIALIVFFGANCKSYLTYSLLVDTLMPIIAAGNAALILYYRRDLRRAALLSLPVMTATVLIKSSGAFFAAINGAMMLAFLIVQLRRNKAPRAENRRTTWMVVGSMALAVALVLVWFVHVYFSFKGAPAVPNSKTEQTEISIGSGPKAKDAGAVQRNLMAYIYSWEKGSPLVMTIGWSGLMLLALLLKRAFDRKWSQPLLLTFALGLSMTLLYILGEYLLYLYIMPGSESASLGGIGRYTYTLFVYLSGVYTMIASAEWLNDLSARRPAPALITVGCAIALCSMVFDPSMFTARQRYEGSLVQRVDQAFVNAPADGTRYAVYLSDPGEASLCKYIVRYKLLDPTTPIITSAEDETKLIAALEGRDELVVVDEDEAMRAFLDAKGAQGDAGVYEVSDLVKS